MKNNYKGTFIAIEGLDGSGKATQSNLLVERLKEEGYKVEKTDFPQYGQKSAGLVEEYLTGRYGTPEEVGPYRASIFYACDRYDASPKIKQWLKEGKVVISDRYLASNIGHQGGKIKNKKERKKYLNWLYNLEYNIFGIPKPDLNFILKTSPEIARKYAMTKKSKDKKSIYIKSNKKDIHEGSKQHFLDSLSSYLHAAKEFPKEFKIIECVLKDKLLPPGVIHEKIWKQLKNIL
jgi:dTMP kinase